jgi:ribosomal protein S18 acetylase RimI-like enzyme
LATLRRVITIRPAEPAEYAAIGALTVAAYEASGQLEPWEDYASVLADTAGRATDSTVLVAVEDGRIFGAVTYCRPGASYAEISRDGEAEFRMLAVDPELRGRRIGELLTGACLRQAREDACAAVVLSTKRSNVAAHRLYERMGFVRVPDRDWSPVPGVDLVVYRIRL